MNKANDQKPRLILSGILVEDTEAKGYTAWIAEFPEAVAEGETEDEAKVNLFQALVTFLEIRREELTTEIDTGKRFKKTSFDLELA